VTRSAVHAPLAVEADARPRGRLPVAFGPRALGMLLIGFAWLVPAFIDSRFVLGLLVWDGAIVVAWLADLRRLPPARQLRVRRSWPSPPALSVPSRVELALVNQSRHPVRATVVDAVPRTLREAPPEVEVRAPAGATAEVSYPIQPGARGETTIGPAYVRYQTALGFAERWAVADVAQTVVTCPDLAEAKRYSIYLIRSRQIDIEKRSTRQRGAGRAFESLRESRTGDEFRDICWTASARRGKLVTRLYEIERSQTVWVLLDSGRLMRARVGALSKLDYAVNAALALAQVALGSGDRVGVLAYGRRIVRRLPAARGSAHLTNVIDALATVQEDEWEADHLGAAGRLLADQKRRSLVVWITDVAETAMTPDVVRAASRLLQRHVVLFVVIGQPDLRALADRVPQTVPEMYDTAAAQEVLHRRERLLATLREGGALALETTASGLSLAIVNGYLDVKQRSRL
jgi:uncharacterized protein (DUF58 family)